MCNSHRSGDIGLFNVDLQQWDVADPRLELDLNGVVAEADDQVGGPQELSLNLPARALDDADGQRMILVDHALGHRRGGERQVVPLDHLQQQFRIRHAHRR
ncbi:MAG: hypothetical protein NTV56_23625 [Alphaproteobacteria bacterium]|nr:hypothetical protein [Alphaproteobacteria bacterium]